MRHRPRLYLSVLAAAVLTACGGDGGDGSTGTTPATGSNPVGNAVALTVSGKLVSFDRATPAQLATNVTVSGMASGEVPLGIDVRPADGRLYLVGSLGRVYTIDPATGVATLKSTLSVDSTDTTSPYSGLSGGAFGVDFNPVADRLRVVSNTGLNLRINVDTGATTTDGTINGAAATITASAYTNSFAGTTSTQLFNLDSSSGTLYLQDPPNNGTLASPVPLGLNFSSANGFDIDGKTNTAYAALAVGGRTSLYTVPLATTGGAPQLVGTIGGGEAVIGLALLGTPTPSALVLTNDNRLAAFAPAAPNTFTSVVSITGLAAGESVVGIDFRPANGRLYGLTSAARLVTIDPATGAATAPIALSADATDSTSPYAGLENATVFTVDFNPSADRLRVITDTGLSLRINVDTGATTTDGRINRTAPATVVAGAYTNSYARAASTSLYDLDATSDVLALQSPPNDGTLVNVGALGVDLSGQNAMDIAGGANGLVLAALRTGIAGPYSLYTVSLTTGAATLYGNTTGDATRSFIGGVAGPQVRDIAIRF